MRLIDELRKKPKKCWQNGGRLIVREPQNASKKNNSPRSKSILRAAQIALAVLPVAACSTLLQPIAPEPITLVRTEIRYLYPTPPPSDLMARPSQRIEHREVDDVLLGEDVAICKHNYGAFDANLDQLTRLQEWVFDKLIRPQLPKSMTTD